MNKFLKTYIIKCWILCTQIFFIERCLLYNIVLVSAIHQHESSAGVHVPPLEPHAYLSAHPTPPGCRRVLGRAPCVTQQIPTGSLFILGDVRFHADLSTPPTLSTSLFSRSVSITAPR